jgi:tRNA G18 (ribose-2'-O)-methylase SpoU
LHWGQGLLDRLFRSAWSLALFISNGLPMDDFVQERHKPPAALLRPRELVIACPPMRSNVNLSRIARAASCCGVRRMICSGNAKLMAEIVRDTGGVLEIETHRTLGPVLKRLRQEGYQLTGLEQTTGSKSLFEFAFARKSVLVIGNERIGIDPEELRLLDHVVEIPVYGMPYSHNAATAGAMALYEYCRQFPEG